MAVTQTGPTALAVHPATLTASTTAAAASTAPAAALVTTPPVTPAAAGPVTAIVGFFASVVSSFLSPFIGAPSAPPGQTPVLWTLLAFVRREITNVLFTHPPAANPTQTSETTDGVITGNLNASSAYGDPLSYTVTQQPTTGTVVVHENGIYTYTPNPGFTQTDHPDAFTVQITDTVAHPRLLSLLQPGFGQTTTVAVPISFTALTTVSGAPVITGVTVGSPNPQTGVVTGTVTASNSLSEPMTYSILQQGAYGTTTIDQSGGFTYTPTEYGRVLAGMVPGGLYEQFTVEVSDADGTATKNVSPEVSPVDLKLTQISVPTQTNTVDGIAVTPSGATVYATNPATNQLFIIDTATRAVTSISFPQVATDRVAVSSDGAYLYIAGRQSFQVIAFNTSNQNLPAFLTVGDGPDAIAASPAGPQVYVAVGASDLVAIIDGTNVTGTIENLPHPVGVAVSPDGTTLYATGAAVPGLGVPLVTVPVNNPPPSPPVTYLPGTAGGPGQIALSPDGRYAYITAGTPTGSGAVVVYDTVAHQVTDTINVGPGANQVAISPDGSLVYVTNFFTNSVDVISTANNQILTTVTLPVFFIPATSTGIAVAPDGTVYVGTIGYGVQEISMVPAT